MKSLKKIPVENKRNKNYDKNNYEYWCVTIKLRLLINNF